MTQSPSEQSDSLADAVIEAIQRAKASVNTGEAWTVTLPFDDWSKIVRLAESVRGRSRS
jgi:hypothetical protein